MNIFRFEWRLHWKSTVLWTVSLIALMGLFLSMYPAISRDVESTWSLLANYPEAFRAAFGLSEHMFTTILGYYSYAFGYVLLYAAIQAMNLGLGLLSRESSEKTADFLLTKPVTRRKIITAKLSAALCSVLLTNGIYLAGAALMVNQMSEDPVNWKQYFLISLIALWVQFMFLTLGLLLSAILRKIRSVLPLSLGIVFSLYALSMLGSVIGDHTIRYVSPFKYFDPAYIIEKNTYELSFVILECVFLAGSAAASYYLYAHKDIPTV